MSIENVVTDSSLDSYVALTANSKCYFTAQCDIIHHSTTADQFVMYRGVAKVKGDGHTIAWKMGLTDKSLAENERNQVVAMTLKTDESRLAVMYHQPYPNTDANSSSAGFSRLVLRLFEASDGTHIQTVSLNHDYWYDGYIGKYATNRDLLYLASNGWVVFNLHQREADNKRHPKWLNYGEASNSNKKIWPYYLKEGTAASSELWGDTAGFHITSFSYIINSFDANNNVWIINSYDYKQHPGFASDPKFAWPRFMQFPLPGTGFMTEYKHMVSTSPNMGLTLYIAALIGRIDAADEIKLTIVT